jgi:hypothetical protein
MRTFKEWIALNENTGLIGPVYHGGKWDAVSPVKTTGRGSLGTGAYFTPDLNRAKEYAKEAGTNNIVEAYVNINNPLEIKTTTKLLDPAFVALTQLGLSEDKANKIIEKAYDQHGYIGKEISSRAIKQGYDGILFYFNNQLSEIVIWNSDKVHSAKILD